MGHEFLLTFFGIHVHGAEFIDAEASAVVADPFPWRRSGLATDYVSIGAIKMNAMMVANKPVSPRRCRWLAWWTTDVLPPIPDAVLPRQYIRWFPRLLYSAFRSMMIQRDMDRDAHCQQFIRNRYDFVIGVAHMDKDAIHRIRAQIFVQCVIIRNHWNAIDRLSQSYRHPQSQVPSRYSHCTSFCSWMIMFFQQLLLKSRPTCKTSSSRLNKQ